MTADTKVTIKDLVRNELSHVRGNDKGDKDIPINAIRLGINVTDGVEVTNEQVSRAIRDLSYVQRSALRGNIRLRGRRVPR